MTPGIVSTYGIPRLPAYRPGDTVWVKGVLGRALVLLDSGETIAVSVPGVTKICLPAHVSDKGPVLEVVR